MVAVALVAANIPAGHSPNWSEAYPDATEWLVRSSRPVRAPTDLPAFPQAKKVRPKTSVQGGGGMRKRWKDSKGNIYEWDSQHGKVELYNKRGKHQGEYDAHTGEQTKPADPKRGVEP
ncbi:colicin E3/pyocin S6 family cytotoxin [Streptomyces niveus]